MIDPAQSAPSAEPRILAEKFLYERLGFAFKAINSCLNVTVFKPFKVMSLSQSDRKWDVVYLMDKAWELLMELAVEKQAAALRTAQLERELQEFRRIESLPQSRMELLTLAETAESALKNYEQS